MRLSELAIFDLRILTEAHLDCGPRLNIISGKNAAGKTTVLEAIHLLARVSSFRTPRINDAIQYGKQGLTITASLMDDTNEVIRTGLEKGRNTTKIRFNGSNINKRSEQARNLPLLIFTPESHVLLTGAPRERRHWLDWSMFHVEPGYIEHWQNYHHALRQRNALLRHHHDQSQFDVWENILAKTTVLLRRARQKYIERINNKIICIANKHMGAIGISLKSSEQDPADIRNDLKQQRGTDILLGYTRRGPHREDVLFNVSGREAGMSLSRGEGKRLILFLILAQAHEYMLMRQQSPVLLIDDVSAELDEEARNNIFAQLKSLDLQAFITTTDPALLEASAGEGCKWFHVEHGNITNL